MHSKPQGGFMRRSLMPDKRWLLLTILMAGLLAMPMHRAQGQQTRTPGQPSDQAPAPDQNQTQSINQAPSQLLDQAQGAEQIEPQSNEEDQDRIAPAKPYNPNDEANYSRARIV